MIVILYGRKNKDMKIRLGQLRQIISEELNFGKYAFAPARSKEGNPKRVPPEENTPIEDAAWNALEDHVTNNVPMKKQAAAIFQKILKAGVYSDVIKGPTSNYLYRGIRVDEDWLAKVGIDTKGESSGSQFVDYIDFPREEGASVSWTESKELAAIFSSVGYGYAPGKNCAVVLVAKSSDNPNIFLKGADGYYDLNPLGLYKVENEATSLGPVKVYKIYWKIRKTDAGERVEPDSVQESRKTSGTTGFRSHRPA